MVNELVMGARSASESQAQRNRPTKTFSLDPASIRIISAVAVEHQMEQSRALDRILREWYTMKFGKRHGGG